MVDVSFFFVFKTMSWDNSRLKNLKIVKASENIRTYLI